ncbi:MAG: elongation factor P maturation arginine rhamnosyltransferase EarP [Gammaproteobacteria bacterium]|nr:elongation factor P maturation arginine rhamnosyltransferase EarP [Gammaproteobacteria bacterium]
MGTAVADGSPAPRTWHLFCRVVDNYGDIGVCWRLARQLHRQHGREVTLWLDELASLQALQPAVDTTRARQECEGVHIRHWAAALPPLDPTDIGEVVIEAFACELPAAYLALMQATRPLWINLEYLSAEEWVVRCHRAPSPRLGLRKFFFFPGFSEGTGGLLWEPEPLHPRQAEPPPATLLHRLLQELEVTGPLPATRLAISLFAYENRAAGELLGALSEAPGGVHLLVPQGRISPAIDAWLGEPLPPGGSCCRGGLTVTALPFMTQRQYDRLLAACDLNFVRGEDSFVRGQMVARPLLWQIYPQQEAAHLVKLEAFLARYTAAMPPPLAAIIVEAHRCWNGAAACRKDDWLGLLSQLPTWQAEARRWQGQLQRLGDLASNLVAFAGNQV